MTGTYFRRGSTPKTAVARVRVSYPNGTGASGERQGRAGVLWPRGAYDDDPRADAGGRGAQWLRPEGEGRRRRRGAARRGRCAMGWRGRWCATTRRLKQRLRRAGFLTRDAREEGAQEVRPQARAQGDCAQALVRDFGANPSQIPLRRCSWWSAFSGRGAWWCLPISMGLCLYATYCDALMGMSNRWIGLWRRR